MCDIKGQCCAPTANNTRCTNLTDGADHCDLHREKARKLYLSIKNYLIKRINWISTRKSIVSIKELHI